MQDAVSVSSTVMSAQSVKNNDNDRRDLQRKQSILTCQSAAQPLLKTIMFTALKLKTYSNYLTVFCVCLKIIWYVSYD